jgi:hypothetical protein
MNVPGFVLCSIALGFAALASAPARAQADAARAMMAKYAGDDDADGLLREPAVRTQLQKLVGAQLKQLERNLNVKGAVDVVGGALSVSGNAPHGGGTEEGVVCVAPHGPRVEAAVYSKGTITVFAAQSNYEYLTLCIKDWITQVNSKHRDRTEQPKNVRLAVKQ